MIHVSDAAEQIAALAERKASGAVYALADGRPEGYGWLEIVRAAAESLGRKPVIAPLPSALLLTAGAAGSALGRLGSAQFFTLGKAREAVHGAWAVTPEEQASGLPQPRFDLPAGFADAAAWYRAHGWL
jgi:nucleoside-diphosphate-sugar epimerase